MKKCGYFCNVHCTNSDCPNIQYDEVENIWGAGIAEDMGMERVKCGECYYTDRRCGCDDCLFYDSMDCPEKRC